MALMLKGKNIMVTGGAGFIGSHLVDRLLVERPGRIIVVDNLFLGKKANLDQALKSDKVLFFEQTVADQVTMEKLLKKYAIEIVFNLAVIPLPTSLVKPRFCAEENINTVLSILELQRKGSFKTLIHFSTSEIYGTSLAPVIDENHPTNALTPYAASKLAGDHLVLSYAHTFNLDVAIVRPFNNYGPRQNDLSYAGVIPLTIRRIQKGESPVIYGDGLQTRDFIHVKDTVDATVSVYKNEKTRGKAINIAAGKEISIRSLINQIANLMNYKGDIIYAPVRPADVMRHKAGTELAKKLLNFRPKTDFVTGLKETVEWYKKIRI